MFCLEDNRNISVYVFITEIIWPTFNLIIDIVQRLCFWKEDFTAKWIQYRFKFSFIFPKKQFVWIFTCFVRFVNMKLFLQWCKLKQKQFQLYKKSLSCYSFLSLKVGSSSQCSTLMHWIESNAHWSPHCNLMWHFVRLPHYLWDFSRQGTRGTKLFWSGIYILTTSSPVI